MDDRDFPRRKAGFAPVVDADTRVLLLGSLPGESSLAKQRYYAHPANRFWHLVGQAIGAELEPRSYAERLDMLARRRIGLWDTVESATRRGSLDAAIRDAEPTALAELAATLPELRMIAFNGAKAAAMGRKAMGGSALGPTSLALIDLPSSSPAYAAMPLGEKEARWAVIADYL